jgi:hypothetical protein
VESASGQFSMLSYNVAGLPEALSGLEPRVNMPLISPLLNDYELVIVQEDWQTPDPNPFGNLEVYHDLLAKDAQHPYQSEPAPLPAGNDPSRPSALVSDGLNRFSMFPFGELTRVSWEGCFGGLDGSDRGAGDCLATKGFSVATHTLADGVEVDVYNLHAEAGATEEDQRLSEEQFRHLADFVNERSAGRAVILGGDTNLHTHDGHPDAWGDGDAIIWQTFTEATGLVDVCDLVSPCDRGIDKLAVRSSDTISLEPLSQLYDRDKFRREDGEPLSDHPPLVVEISWTFEAQ